MLTILRFVSQSLGLSVSRAGTAPVRRGAVPDRVRAGAAGIGGPRAAMPMGEEAPAGQDLAQGRVGCEAESAGRGTPGGQRAGDACMGKWRAPWG